MFKESKIVPINPFTPQQREFIALRLKGFSNKQIAIKMTISTKSVENIVSGTVTSKDKDKNIYQKKSMLGITGIIQQLTKTDQKPGSGWLESLYGDVVFATKEHSVDAFIDFIHKSFDRKSVNAFSELGQYGLQFEDLSNFLKSPFIDGNLRQQWNYETDPKWKDRSTETAVSETLSHAFAVIWGNIEVYRKNKTGSLKKLTPDKVEQIAIRQQFVNDYFAVKFRSINQAVSNVIPTCAGSNLKILF